MCPLYTHVTSNCNASVHEIYSGVSGQCSHTIYMVLLSNDYRLCGNVYSVNL